MSDAALRISYAAVVPLVSRLRPAVAYAVNVRLGRLGKSSQSYCSYLYDTPAAPVGIAALVSSLQVSRDEASSIMKTYFLLETRCEIENRWLIRGRREYLNRIISADEIQRVSEVLCREGPFLLLSAHCTYYFMVLWALHELGNRVAFMMMDPRLGGSPRGPLQGSLARSVEALEKYIPVLFTNEGNTVSRAVEMLGKGYSMMMLLDVPGYRDRGEAVRLFGQKCRIPAGSLRILKESRVPAGFVFPYAASVRDPYRVFFAPHAGDPGAAFLQQWADALERVAGTSPASWLGWLGLHAMVEPGTEDVSGSR